jgi:hypothetical protein
MPTPAFCALDEAYKDWTFGPGKKQFLSKSQPDQNSQQNNQKESADDLNFNSYSGSEAKSDIRTFCPNCQNCLQANDVLQQRIIEQNIWPRPRWVPQYPNAYTSYDPFNRYWANNPNNSIGQNFDRREDFGNFQDAIEKFTSGNNTESILLITLFILIALFLIQLVECMNSK